MFEAAELGVEVSKADYKAQAPELRLALLQHQFQARDAAAFPVVVVLVGDDRQGCEGALALLNEWLDPRFIETHTFGNPSDEERERPEFWRYWRRLPAKGRVGVFLGGWPALGIVRRVRREFDEVAFDRWIRHVNRFERALVADGAALLKLWLHVPQAEHARRLDGDGDGERPTWRVHEAYREVFADYARGRRICEQVLRLTSSGETPWHVIESSDWRARNLAVARKLLRAVSKRLTAPEPEPELATLAIAREGAELTRTVLDTVDLSARLDKDDYSKALDKERRKLRDLAHAAFETGKSMVLVFEGWDAAGKGGAVRRLTAAVNPAYIKVKPIAAPSDVERGQHWLWRFWQHLPRAGCTTVFDRSWYGRVLVERVEGFARPEDWRRAYSEINDFEEQLVEHGTIVHKFWLHIDADEQLRRFEEREASPLKTYKITDEDWRNRERWDAYEQAVNEMVARTSTEDAPWSLIAGNDKRHARVEILRTVRKRLERALSAGGEGRGGERDD